MMVAGTYVLTDTIDRSFERIFTQSNEGVDAVVTSKQNIETFEDVAPPFPASVLQPGRVRSTGSRRPRARSATSRSRSSAPTAIRAAATARPSLGFSVSVPYDDRFDPLTYVEGGPPMSADEVVIDKASAEDEGFEVGDTVTIAGRAATDEYTLSGIATLGDVDSFGGATIAVLTLPEAQRLTGKEGEFDQISVAADEGVSPDRLAASLKAALPTTSTSRPAPRTSSPSATTSASSPASSRPRC